MSTPMGTKRRRWSLRLYALPAALVLCLTIPKLWQGIFAVDTGWYAAIGLQGWRAAGEGDWSHLWSLTGYGGPGPEGTPYFNKPPLAFWIHGFVLWLMGPSILAARLPSVVAAIGSVLCTVAAVRTASGRRTAVLAGIVLAMTLEFTRHARAISLDMWQLLFFCAALWIACSAVASGRGRRLAALGVPIGLALLTKPLVGLIPLAIVAVWLVWIGRARWCGWVLAAALVAAAIAAPWHVSMYAIHGEAFTSAYFGREIMQRAAGRIEGMNADATSPLYYLVELARQYWPWLITVVLAIAAWVRRAWAGRGAPPPAGVGQAGWAEWASWGLKLAVLWSLAWLVLLSMFADKRPRYLLPAYPAWSWMTAVWLVHDAPAWVKRVRNGVERWALPVGAVAAAVVAVAPIRLDRGRGAHYPAMFERLRELGATEVWEGGLPEGARGARVYLHLGRWPRRTHAYDGTPIAAPAPGDLVMYHEEDGWAPGPGETIEFRQGPITLSRVGEEGWSPVWTRPRE